MPYEEYIRRPRNHACTQCKQMKVRCEGQKHASLVDPCRRCSARGLECVVDLSFKRTPARQRAKAIEAELSRLRHEVEQQHMQSHALSNTFGPLTPFSTPSPSLIGGTQVFVDPALQGSQGSLAEVSQTHYGYHWMLGPVNLTQQEVEKAFEIYKQHFHWQLTIVDTGIPMNVLHTCSPFLFWTIVVITRQRFVTDDVVAKQTELTKHYLALLKSTVLEPPLSLHTIQGIVLLSFWPLPIDSQLRDPGWLYMDVAISAARWLDLDGAANRPFYHGGQLSERDMQIASRTWLAIFVVSSS
nr:regulatory protein leu3 [Quercus suber]